MAATLNSALRCLFEHALGKMPSYDEVEPWKDACREAFTAVAKSSASMTWADMYAYFSKEVEATAKLLRRRSIAQAIPMNAPCPPGGVSAKSVDALFKSLDRASRGAVTLQEFSEVVMQRLSSLRAEKELEMRLAERVPRLHVVPGSNRLNCLAKTEAFRVQVVTRPMVRELGRLWTEMDADHDGRVTLADLRRYFTRTQPGLLPFLTSIFRAIEGKGRTGMVTFAQLLKALYPEASPADLRTLQAMSATRKSRMEAAAAEAAANDKLLAEIQGVFSVFDDDQRGELDEEEFISAMELTGHIKEEAQGMFKVIDEEGSGVVRWAAFRKWYTNNYTRFMEESQRDFFEDVPGEDSS